MTPGARQARIPLLLAAALVLPSQDTPFMVARVEPHNVLATVKGMPVYDAGYGSALALDPRTAGSFYLLADRGPNYDAGKETKAFVNPEYAPRIGRFRLEKGTLTLTGRIEFKQPDGRLLTGLPPAAGQGGTGETALDTAGKVLADDPEGADPEGLVALPDGGFWVSEEYGPSLIHLDASGYLLERVRPFGDGHRLPRVFQRRRANRGLEGLTMLPDGYTLLAAMEGPLDNPKEAGRKSTLTRLLAYDTRTGKSRQYVVLADDPDLRHNDIAAINNHSALLIERDPRQPGDPQQPSTVKHVIRIDFARATDVSDSTDAAGGLLVGGKTLEALSPADLQAAGIVPASRELILDLLAYGYKHDKPEGLAIVDDSTVAVSNDDDFGVTEGPAPKLIPGLGVADFNEVYFFRLARPLR